MGNFRGGRATRPASNELFDLSRPELDWVKLAGGMGVEATRVETSKGSPMCSKRHATVVALS